MEYEISILLYIVDNSIKWSNEDLCFEFKMLGRFHDKFREGNLSYLHNKIIGEKGAGIFTLH